MSLSQRSVFGVNVQSKFIIMSVIIHTVGIIMNSVTGRIGTNQYLLRALSAIVRKVGVQVSPSELIIPNPVLVGRDTRNLINSHSNSQLSKPSKLLVNFAIFHRSQFHLLSKLSIEVSNVSIPALVTDLFYIFLCEY